MKLRSRLVITFCVVTLIPLILFEISLFALMRSQVHTIEKNYGIEDEGFDSLYNSFSIASKGTETIYAELQDQARQKPDLLEETDYLDQVAEELNKKNFHLILRKGDEIRYMDDPVCQEYEELLTEYGKGNEDVSSGIYIGGENQVYFKQLDFQFSDHSRGSLFLIMNAEEVRPQVHQLFRKIMIAMIGILVFTAVILIYWIYMSILNPLYRLQRATNEIKSGNLDFVLEETKGEDEFSGLFRDFEEMRLNLKESEDEKRKNDAQSKELISNISHDLKTPITAVKGYCEGILDGVADTPEKIDRYVRTIYNKANDMDRLINELTFYSKIDTNRIPYSFARINVKYYFDDCAEELALDLESKQFQFTYENQLDSNTYMIADAEQMKRVINNIVGNSVKYRDKEEGKISLLVRDAGDFIQVELKDNGKGIDAHDLPYIFDRFFRTDQSRNSAMGGSGIGLSIVKKIIEDHNGRIWANSKLGEGTTMIFVIRKYMEAFINE